MRSRAAQLVDDHFRVGTIEDVLVWENCTADPFAEVSLVAPEFTMTEVTEDQLLDPLTRVKLS